MAIFRQRICITSGKLVRFGEEEGNDYHLPDQRPVTFDVQLGRRAMVKQAWWTPLGNMRDLVRGFRAIDVRRHPTELGKAQLRVRGTGRKAKVAITVYVEDFDPDQFTPVPIGTQPLTEQDAFKLLTGSGNDVELTLPQAGTSTAGLEFFFKVETDKHKLAVKVQGRDRIVRRRTENSEPGQGRSIESSKADNLLVLAAQRGPHGFRWLVEYESPEADDTNWKLLR